MSKKKIFIILSVLSLLIIASASFCWFFLRGEHKDDNQANDSSAQSELTGNFEVDLFKKTFEETSENTVISPFSIKIAMSMASEGADKETLKELYKVLEIDANSKSEFKELLDDISSQKDVTFNIANSVWGRDDFEFKKSFIDTVVAFYKAEAWTLDFFDPESANRINDWVKDKTKGKIEKIVDEISPDHLMFIINAIYFNGTWTSQFNEDYTQEEDFMLSDGLKLKHELMYMSSDFRYQENDNFQAVELPYGEDKRFVMRVYLPGEDKDIDSFISDLDYENLKKWNQDFEEKEGELKLPKFKTEFSISLKEILENLGLKNSFSVGDANFSKMIEKKLNVFIGDVKHKTYIDVNEEGTEAAAVTSVEMKLTESLPEESDKFKMFVDRPFFFTIEDTQKDTLIFMGTILDPSK